MLRLARRLGLTGYPELRIALAEASAQAPGWRRQLSELEASDSVNAVVNKVAHAHATAVEDTAQRLDRTEVAAVAQAMATAGRVDIVGIGASALVASDLQLKLHRIGRLGRPAPGADQRTLCSNLVTWRSRSRTRAPRSSRWRCCARPTRAGRPQSRSPTRLPHR